MMMALLAEEQCQNQSSRNTSPLVLVLFCFGLDLKSMLVASQEATGCGREHGGV